MPFEVDVIVLSNINKQVGAGVDLRVGLPTGDPWSLPFGHQRLFADRLDDYDVFIYSEDDVLITRRNIDAFLRVVEVLPKEEIPGFLRYEQGADGEVNYPDVHGHFHWDAASARLRGHYVLAFLTNEHSACYALTRGQLRRAINSGGYLVDAHEGRYDLLCTAATDPYTQCGFTKLVCISHVDDFLVHHLPNNYVGTAFGVGDRELRGQLGVLLGIAQNGQRPAPLFPTETKLKGCTYSKNYYEPAEPEVLSAIPEGVKTVLSVGCGWGSTERRLSERGLHVSAVPLDPVIPCGARAGGIEIIDGDLATARRALAGKKFDCLLISNVLHLVPDPVGVLSSCASLLPDDGTAVAVTPNMARLTAIWRWLRGDAGNAAPGSYERTGVHRVSKRVLSRWFRSAGMRVERVVQLGPRSTLGRRLVARLLGSWMADGFVVVARKHSSTRAR